jgi:hypothetical protein
LLQSTLRQSFKGRIGQTLEEFLIPSKAPTRNLKI